MRHNYLVVFMNGDYQTDFLILLAENHTQAKEKVSASVKVLEIFSVWCEVEDE